MEITYTFSFLEAHDMSELHQTFLKSFEDYFVPIKLTDEQFKLKLSREGISPSFCVGAYDGKRMVGFILTGLGEFNCKPTAYNAGTGVLPAHRGHNLTQKMYDFLLPKLRAASIEQCVLEVIHENKAAIRSYEASGFKISRSLSCFRATKDELLLNGDIPTDITIAAVKKPDWKTYRHFWDVEPTWQNTSLAITRSPDAKIILEARNEMKELAGYIAFFPNTGGIAQFAVDKVHKGKSTGKALLREAAAATTAPALLFVNVDDSATELITFLKRRHFTRFLGQYEMEMNLY
jgi:ribosomal protein S18 acetylase RimI-like enzyme